MQAGSANAADWGARFRAGQPHPAALPTSLVADLVPADHPNPLVAVLVRVHDDGEFLLDALASIRADAGVPVQVRVIDDSSTEPGTLLMLQQVRDTGVRVLAGPGVGASAALNFGLADTSAPFILPLDVDNLLRPGFLSIGTDALAADPTLAVVHGHAWRFRTGDAPIGDGRTEGLWPAESVTARRMALGNYVDNCALMRRADLEAVGAWCETITQIEDWDLWLTLLERGCGFLALDRLSFAYRLRAGQLTANHGQAEMILQPTMAVVGRYRHLHAEHVDAIYEAMVHARLALVANRPRAASPPAPLDRREPSSDDSSGDPRLGALDPAWYLATYPDVAAAGLDPAEHFERHGRAEGRRPCPPPAGFDPAWYLLTYPDVAEAGVDPWVHWLSAGRAEGRVLMREDPGAPRGWCGGAGWYAAQYPQDAAPDMGGDLAAYAHRRTEANRRTRTAQLLRAWEAELDQALATPAHPILDLTPAGPARVTVVIPVWDGAALTLQCLRALAEMRLEGPDFDVIVVDDASTDRTAELLIRVRGITVLRHARNRGYVDAANTGLAAALARPACEHVLLVNNDASPRPGALAAALDTMADPAVGAVGARVLLPHGLLQEAGCVAWGDGQAEGVLRGWPWQAGAAMHRRDVDYCSGAFLLLRRTALQRVGLLDPAFGPGYYEELDWCLRAWAAGFRVVYDPRVIVDHAESASMTSRRARELMSRNRPILLARHARALANRPRAGVGNVLDVALLRRTRRPRVLMVDHQVPRTTSGAGFPRAIAFVLSLAAQGADVTLLPLHQSPFADWQTVHAEIPIDVEVLPELGLAGLAAHLHQRLGWYDLLIASRESQMRVLQHALSTEPQLRDGAMVAYDAEAIPGSREVARAAALGQPLSPAEAKRRIESSLAWGRAADVVLAVHPPAAAAFAAAGAPRVLVLPHVVEAEPGPDRLDQRDGLLLVGPLADDGSPNVDGAEWFVLQVLPLVREMLGRTVPVDLVGLVGERARRLGRQPGVRLRGPLPDLSGAYAAARVALAPTRFADGIPLKVLGAAGAGVPTVVTPLLAEQLDWRDGVEVLVGGPNADDGSFAAACARLLTDDDLWRRIRFGALSAVTMQFSAARFDATVAQLLAMALPAARDRIDS